MQIRGMWLSALGALAACDGNAQAAGRDGTGAGGGSGAVEVHDVPCDKLYKWQETFEGNTWRYRRLYAELQTDTVDLTSVSAMKCDPDPAGKRPGRPPCPATPPGQTCTGDPDPEPPPCEVAMGIQVGNGKVRVLCGAGSGHISLPEAELDSYFRYSRVRFALTR